MEGDENNLKGVVIICLPPPENPSQGKHIIGALTYNTENPSSDLPSVVPQPEEDDHLPLAYTVPSPPELPILSDRPTTLRPLRSKRLKRLVSVFFSVVVAYCIWQYAPSQVDMDMDFEDMEESNQEDMMLFSIYSKALTQIPLSNSSVASIPAYPNGFASISPMTLNLVERDVVRNSMVGSDSQAQSSTSQETSTTIFSLRGNVYPDGLYYVSARIGNPSKEYFLDMDTGSDLTWVQCDAPCTSCAKGPHTLYRPRKINLVDCKEASCSTIQAGSRYNCGTGSGQCNYDITYADRGFSLGVLVRDQLAMILTNRSFGYTNAVFGCAYNQQGSLAKSPSLTDGVLGLSSSRISLPSQLAKQGLIKNLIGHCISGNNKGGGYLFFGDKLLPSQGMSWAPFIGKPETKNYVLSVDNVFVGNAKLEMDPQMIREVIFDSGTSYTYLVSTVYSVIVSSIQKSLIGTPLSLDETDDTLPLCWKGDAPFSSLEYVETFFKPIVLEFRSSLGWLSKASKMHLYPEGYLIKNSKGNICLGLLDANVLGKSAPSIIGDISMQGMLIVYDNENHRLGWMKTDCRKIPRSAVLSPSI